MRILIDPTIWRLEISMASMAAFYNSKVEKAISFVPPLFTPPSTTTHHQPPSTIKNQPPPTTIRSPSQMGAVFCVVSQLNAF